MASEAGVQHGLAVGVMAAGLAVALAIGTHASGRSLDTGDLSVVAAVLGGVALGAWCALRRGLKAPAIAILGATVFFAVVLLALLDMALLATQARPFADPLFATADEVIAPWLDWPGMARWFAAHPPVARSCEWVYHSIAWQPLVLIGACCASGRAPETWRFIGMWTLSLLLCQIVFAFLPGIGAYGFHGVDPALVSPTSHAVSTGQSRLLSLLRSPSLARIGAGCIGGMITFPSFHAVAAALLARGYWRIPALRWPFAVLNLLMLGTAIPMGGHYVVDLVAGLAVAALAIRLFDASPLRLPDAWRPVALATAPPPARAAARPACR